MKKLLVLTMLAILLQLTPTQASEDFKEEFKFDYIANMGPIYLNCTHVKLETEPEFYRVTCGKAPGVVKVFDARFRVRQMSYEPQPVSFEIVFWVTDRNLKERYDNGTTLMINLDQGKVLDLRLHQEVENAYASLVVRYKRTYVTK